jgi:PTS system fructose-specific IIA component/PTS system nitrogen regulatory IIA component
MKLCELVQPGSIIPALASEDRNGAIRDLVQVLAGGGLLDPDSTESIIRSIITRERTRGTTGFGKGAAIPHTKVDALDRVVAAVGRSPAGVDFGSLDGQPVYTIFLILSPSDRADDHVQAMNLIFGHLQQEQFRKFMRQSDTAEKIFDLLKEADEKTLVT